MAEKAIDNEGIKESGKSMMQAAAAEENINETNIVERHLDVEVKRQEDVEPQSEMSKGVQESIGANQMAPSQVC